MYNLADEKRYLKSLSSQKAYVITHIPRSAYTCHIYAFIPLFTADLPTDGTLAKSA